MSQPADPEHDHATLVEEAMRRGKRDLLDYLIHVAQETHGSEVWRALFAELRAKY